MHVQTSYVQALKQRVRTSVPWVGAACLASALSLAQAQEPPSTPWALSVGVSHIDPKGDNGRILPGDVSIGSNTGPSLNLSYFVTPHWAVNVLGGLPFKHTIRVNGAEAGSTKHLPPIVSLQYHFLPQAKVQPFVGVGVNYTTFLSEKLVGGGRLSLSDSWGGALQAGVLIPVDQRWSVGFDVRYADIATKVRINGTDVGKVHIDPTVYSLQVGYRF